ncbi:MAG: hypothetical protein ACOYL3_23750 [Desulfuromonadaceae bacterium]
MKETVIVHNKERKKKLVTVTSHLVVDDNGVRLEGRTYKRYSPNFPYRDLNLEREAGIIALANQSGLPCIRLINYSQNEGVLETEYVPGENLAERLANPFITQDELRLLVISVVGCIESHNCTGIVLVDTHPSNFIFREDSGECIFCDFGLAFAPQKFPFVVPPPTRCDRVYFSEKQNRAIAHDLTEFTNDNTSTSLDYNRLQTVGDMYVLANQLLSNSSALRFDSDLLHILKKMKKEQYQSVSEILQDLDETTPLHLKGTPHAVPLNQADDAFAYHHNESKQWVNGIYTSIQSHAGLIAAGIAMVAVFAVAAVNVKPTTLSVQTPSIQKPQPVPVASVAEVQQPVVANVPNNDAVSVPETAPQLVTPDRKVAQPSPPPIARREEPEKQENPNKQLLATASKLISNPSRYQEGIAALSSLSNETEARLLLSQEFEKARNNTFSQRLSLNRKGIQDLYILKENKSIVSDKARSAIEEFYEKAKSTGDVTAISRLQLLAARKHSGAQFSLGKIHEQAGVRKRNYATAYRYYTTAQAENDDARKAVTRLEQSVVVTLLQSKDSATRQEGFRLLLAIAEIPANKEAQYSVGKIYQSGVLGVKNIKLARAYLKQAARNGKEDAAKELARL